MLKIDNMSFSYANKMDGDFLLKGINLEVNKGDYISIVGENGAGKSTLLKLILGFIKPTLGTIDFDEKSLGYVPQKFDNINSEFPITVYEMLNCHRKILKLRDKKVVDIALDTVKMKSFKNELLGSLSGGQRQKIFIARSLIGNPELLILDEPSTGIDVASQSEIYKLLNHLNKVHKISILAVEHNLKAALLNSTSIFSLNEGEGKLLSTKEYKEKLEGDNLYASV